MTIQPVDDMDIPGPFAAVVLTTLPEDAPEYAKVLHENMAAIASGINQTNTNIANALDAINAVKNEVGPIVERLSNMPMFKMFLGGK